MHRFGQNTQRRSRVYYALAAILVLFTFIACWEFLFVEENYDVPKESYENTNNNGNTGNNHYVENTDSGNNNNNNPSVTSTTGSPLNLDPNRTLPPIPGVRTSDKWVVVTTINYPTDAVQAIAAIPGWRVVVVADKKTPSDWKYDNCDFISVDKQEELGYAVTSLLPWNHYGRKNIGYLYAVQHGAKLIYETDDDNLLLNTKEVTYFPAKMNVHRITSTLNTSNVVNPYTHFGEPTVWPRGFPLEEINKGGADYNLYRPEPTPIYIQQGLANKDPDVDAIYRLTRKLNITFRADVPPVTLPAGIMTPFNSQNTVFHYESLWGLLIPITTTFRVCDIWRGYWAQRLLWDIGGTLTFFAPSVIQNRNPHHLLEDYIDEDDLYKKSGKLITFLRNWSNESPDFFERVQDLSTQMYKSGFWKEGDMRLTQAWLSDLKAIGYQPPKVNPVYRPGDKVKIPDAQKLPKTAPNAGAVSSRMVLGSGINAPQNNQPLMHYVTVMIPFKDDPQGTAILVHMRNFVGSFHKNLPGHNLTVYYREVAYPQVAEVQHMVGVDVINIDDMSSSMNANMFQLVFDHAMKHYGNFLFVGHHLRFASADPINNYYSVEQWTSPFIYSTDESTKSYTVHDVLNTMETFYADKPFLVVTRDDDGRALDAPLVYEYKYPASYQKPDAIQAAVLDENWWCWLEHRVIHPNIPYTVTPKPTNNIVPKVCLVAPSTGKRSDGPGWLPLNELPFYNKMLLSTLQTIDKLYDYTMYIGYDIGDGFFDDDANRQALQEFVATMNQNLSVNLTLKMYKYPRAFANNVWFWNELAFEAYDDNCDYFFQLGDDMVLQSREWASVLINALQTRTEFPNVGAVAPTGGSVAILVDSFVHRTHMELFGSYFPREFKNWWADDWMTMAYRLGVSAHFIAGAQINHAVVSHRYVPCMEYKVKMEHEWNNKTSYKKMREYVEQRKEIIASIPQSYFTNSTKLK